MEEEEEGQQEEEPPAATQSLSLFCRLEALRAEDDTLTQQAEDDAGAMGDWCAPLAGEPMPEEAQEAVGVPGAVAQLRTLKYRKVQGFEYDDSYREYMGLPLFRDITAKIIGDRVSIFRSMFFKCAKPQSSTLPVCPRTLSSDDPGPTSKPAADPGVSEGGVVINW